MLLPARVVILGVVLVILITMSVYLIEFFIPLSAKSDMNFCCRNTLLKMEVLGGLTVPEKLNLQSELENKGFSNTVIDGTTYAKQGEEIVLHVEADYIFSRLSGLFTRRAAACRMLYDKTSTSRKVVN